MHCSAGVSKQLDRRFSRSLQLLASCGRVNLRSDKSSVRTYKKILWTLCAFLQLFEDFAANGQGARARRVALDGLSLPIDEEFRKIPLYRLAQHAAQIDLRY